MKRLFFLILFTFCLQVSAQTEVDYLYKYMPLCDRADYSRSFFEANVAQTDRALKEMPWGRLVNDTLVRHFILPLRVNNEPLDSFRLLYYEELASRVRGLSMSEAAIAINHWCHEKVTYQPSDGRTSSPMQSIRTAFGRCGEESTLCVAAMRTVGIPARQVYTPRWAHCDDNHAWVEVWTDGAWHFLGACEPEPVLDLGWFNAPASRGMMMHTRVFGDYYGQEDIVLRTPTYTEINVTPNYAPTRRVHIRITDTTGKAIPQAQVEFKIYNYAEFYTAVSRLTDNEGKTSLVSGHGDLLVWASKDGRFNYRKVNFASDTVVTIVLNKIVGQPINEALDIHVPQANYTLPPVSQAQRNHNDIALAHEDSLRKAYERTMPALPTIATENDSILWKSRGNAAVIRTFLCRYGAKGLPLLRTLTDKDLRDVTLSVLLDHQQHSNSTDPRILSPRVALEPLTPWRNVLQRNFSLHTVEAIRRWCDENLTIISDSNLNGTFITPLGVLATRRCDKRSRDVFFVCLCRAMGFSAWLDPITGQVQTESGPAFSDAMLTNHETEGTLRFTGNPSLGYINHFTMSRLTPQGTLSLLTFPEEAPLGTLQPKNLPIGTYLLTTGTRCQNGNVLATMQTFNIEAGKETIVNVQPRAYNDTSSIYGHLDRIENPTIFAFIAEGQEPSNHVVRDICARRDDFDRIGIDVFFLFSSEIQKENFLHQDLTAFPSKSHFHYDHQGSILASINQQISLHNASNWPIVIYVDAKGNIRYYHQGYTIGIGEALLRAAETNL